MTDEPVKQGGLHAKLAEVGQTVTHVEKDGKNSFHNYDFASASAVLAVIRKPLFERGVTVTPRIVSIEDREYTTAKGKASVVTTVTVNYTFVDAGSGEREECVWAGRGDDNADKGLSKALTSAAKSFILGTFLLPTGDDPEADTETDRSAADRRPTPRRQQAPPSIVDQVAAEVSAAKGVDVRALMESMDVVPQGGVKATLRSMTPEAVETFRAKLASAVTVAEARAKLDATEVAA